MADEVHEVVTLLLARMESNPEEFKVADVPFHDRWYDHVNAIQAFGSEADKAAIAAGLRKIRLAETHERVMDELLNGEDRRRKEAEDREYERHLAHAAMQQQQNAYTNQIQGMVGQVYGGGGSGVYGGGGGAALSGYQNAAGAQGLVGKSPTQLYGDYGIITGTQANSIMIDDQVLDAPMIKKIKKMLSGRSK